MIKYIDPKKFWMFFRILLFFFSLIMVCYNFYASIEPTTHYFGDSTGNYLFVVGISLVLLIITGLQILYFPTSVIIDDELKQLSIKYLLLKSKTVAKKDLTSYKEVYIKSRVARYDGIVLKLKYDKQILFSELNLDNYMVVADFLEANKVEYTGQSNFSSFSYYINQ